MGAPIAIMARAVGIIQAKDDIACVQQNQSTRINQAAYFAVWTIKPINISIFWVTKNDNLNLHIKSLLRCHARMQRCKRNPQPKCR